MIGELQEWIGLAENYAGEIEQFDLICFFCAQPFEEELVNADCQLNKTPCAQSPETRARPPRAGGEDASAPGEAKEREDGGEGFTQERPAGVFFGNRRWAREG